MSKSLFVAKIASSLRKFICFIGVLFLSLPSLGGPAQDQDKLIQSTAPELRLKWFERHLAMKESSVDKAFDWEFIGPDNISGRLTDVDVHPRHKHVIYAASASGGVWKTVNAGTTWIPIFENAPSTSMGDVTIAPSHPGIVWLGTGEPNILRSSQAGTGVYISTDRGRTWSVLGGNLPTTYVHDLVVHPRDGILVAATHGRGMWTIDVKSLQKQ